MSDGLASILLVQNLTECVSDGPARFLTCPATDQECVPDEIASVFVVVQIYLYVCIGLWYSNKKPFISLRDMADCILVHSQFLQIC